MAGLVKTENVTNSREVEKARIILIGLGILPSKKGFNYMADCIYLFSEGNKSLHAVYQEVSERHGVSLANLDRCMRTCLGGLSSTDTIEKINRMARFPIACGNTIFTCSNFIALLSEFLRADSYLNF